MGLKKKARSKSFARSEVSGLLSFATVVRAFRNLGRQIGRTCFTLLEKTEKKRSNTKGKKSIEIIIIIIIIIRRRRRTTTTTTTTMTFDYTDKWYSVCTDQKFYWKMRHILLWDFKKK